MAKYSKDEPRTTQFGTPGGAATSLGDLLKSKLGDLAPLPSAAPAPVPPTAAPTAPSLPLAKVGKLVVSREKKGRGGKTVTVVSGLGPLADGTALTLKKFLGCGATLEEDVIVLQGDQVQRTAAWLESQGARRVSRSG